MKGLNCRSRLRDSQSYQKQSFWTYFRWFFMKHSLNEVQFAPNLQWFKCKAMHHMLQFLTSSKKSYKLSQKTVFLAHFRFFVYTFLCHLNYARTFCHSFFLIGIHSNEGWTVTTEHMKLRNRGKFHQYTICGCQVKQFSKSPAWMQGSFLRGFWVITPATMVQFCWYLQR